MTASCKTHRFQEIQHQNHLEFYLLSCALYHTLFSVLSIEVTLLRCKNQVQLSNCK